MLDCLNRAAWFMELDLKSGNWQDELDEAIKLFTMFTVGLWGFYECDQGPFGLINDPATFRD